MEMNKVNSFIYPDIKIEDRRYAGLGGSVVNPSGDWQQYLTPFEDQNVNGVESSACYVEANQATIAILKEYIYGIKDENYSARFNALLSGGTPTGGDPLKGAYSIKKDGLIPQSMMDWKGIDSWDEFHSWEGVDKDKCLLEGKKEASLWDKKYYILSEKDDPIEVKYNNLREGLKRSPVPLSVYAWLERDGKYYKPAGARDTHLTTGICIGLTDNNEIIVRDTYKPYIKVLEANTDFEFSMYWVVTKRSVDEQYKNILVKLLDILKSYVSIIKNGVRVGGEIIEEYFRPRY